MRPFALDVYPSQILSSADFTRLKVALHSVPIGEQFVWLSIDCLGERTARVALSIGLNKTKNVGTAHLRRSWRHIPSNTWEDGPFLLVAGNAMQWTFTFNAISATLR